MRPILYFTPATTAIVNMQDHSFTLTPEVVYTGFTNWELSGRSVSTIISLAHSLRLIVIAEGVETEDQAKVLRSLRCDEMQGYLISRPVPEGELRALLGRTSS